MELRVNPEALRATSAVLSEVGLTPTLAAQPASAHPVSAAAAAQLNAVAANLAQLTAHAKALAGRAAVGYIASAADYENTDASGSHGVMSARAALHTVLGGASAAPPPLPGPVAVAPPIPPHPPTPIPIPHPPAPVAEPLPADAAAAALHTGDQGASITELANVWRTAATTLDGYHQSVTAAADNLKTQWSGEAASGAVGRLIPFGEWFADAAAAHRAAADTADQLVAAHARAVADHPTPQYLQNLKTQLSDATARAAAGDVAAIGQAEDYRQQLLQAQTDSSTVSATYASHSVVPEASVPAPPSPINPGPQVPPAAPGKTGPGEPAPKPGDTDGGPHKDVPKAGDKPGDPLDTGEARQLKDPPKPGSLPKDPLLPEGQEPSPPTDPLEDPALQPPAAAAPSVMPMMAPLMQGLSQGAQQAGQVPGTGQGMPTMPTMPTPPMTPSSMPQTPTPPMPESPFDPAAFDPAGGGGVGAGGGGGAGMPAAAPGLSAGAAVPLNSSPPPASAPPAGGPTAGIGAGMPMGMMPHNAGNRGTDKPRSGDLAPDEPVYVEERPNTTAFIGGTIGPEPPPEAQE